MLYSYNKRCDSFVWKSSLKANVETRFDPAARGCGQARCVLASACVRYEESLWPLRIVLRIKWCHCHKEATQERVNLSPFHSTSHPLLIDLHARIHTRSRSYPRSFANIPYAEIERDHFWETQTDTRKINTVKGISAPRKEELVTGSSKGTPAASALPGSDQEQD